MKNKYTGLLSEINTDIIWSITIISILFFSFIVGASAISNHGKLIIEDYINLLPAIFGGLIFGVILGFIVAYIVVLFKVISEGIISLRINRFIKTLIVYLTIFILCILSLYIGKEYEERRAEKQNNRILNIKQEAEDIYDYPNEIEAYIEGYLRGYKTNRLY